MSNSRQEHQAEGNRKIIGLKPVVKKVESIPVSTPEDELQNVEQQLEIAKEKLARVKQEAEQTVQQANEQAEKQKSDWLKEKERLYEEVKQQGYQAGFEMGKQEGIMQYEGMLNEAKAIINDAKTDYEAVLEKSEDTVLELAIRAASRIIHRELAESDVFANIVQQVIREAKDQEKIAVYSHPDDYQVIMKQKDELRNIVVGQAELYFYPVLDLAKGSCIVETSFGRIDAGVDTRLLELRDKLFEVSRGNPNEH
ncbi:flagellar assembly protein FliH [Sediminibacillus albus]|uniref:flagellar assembly protein FliH n=1 Tax=Sediminibacillus albus TaxID=407036 RepID=UPI0015880FAE|nr:flagellar assembly protein FliH [Sediminibacillus albus]